MQDDYRSFADEDTHFTLATNERGRPTGEVICDGCGESASAPEYIPHTADCSQNDVYSEWYAEMH